MGPAIAVVVVLGLFAGGRAAACYQTAPSNASQLGLYFCPDQQNYLVKAQVGTPPQNLTLLVYLEFSALLIALPDCTVTCPQNTFNEQLSATFQLGHFVNSTYPDNLLYLLRQVSGFDGSDFVSLKPALFGAYNCAVFWLTQCTPVVNESMPYDGIFGMNPFFGVNNPDSNSNIFENAQTPYAISLQPAGMASCIYLSPFPAGVVETTQWVETQNAAYLSGFSFGGSGNLLADEYYSQTTFVLSSVLQGIYLSPSLFEYYTTNYAVFPNCQLTDQFIMCMSSCASLELPNIQLELLANWGSDQAVVLNVAASNYTTSPSKNTCTILLGQVPYNDPLILGLSFLYQYVVSVGYPQGNQGNYPSFGFSGDTQSLLMVGMGRTAFMATGEAICLAVAVLLLMGSVVQALFILKSPHPAN